MTFRPHQHSDKTPEELAAQRARRLQLRIARALLREDDAGECAIDAAVKTLHDSCKDPAERGPTRNHAAETLLGNANKAAGNVPQTIINQGIRLDGPTLMGLVREGASGVPNSGSLVSHGEQPPLPAPTGDLQGDRRLEQPVIPPPIDAADRTDGPPERASSAPAPDGPPPAPVSPEPTGTAGDPTRCDRCHARTDDEPHQCPVPEDA